MMMIVLVLGKKDPMDLLLYRVPRQLQLILGTYQLPSNYPPIPTFLTISKKQSTTPITLKDSDNAYLGR